MKLKHICLMMITAYLLLSCGKPGMIPGISIPISKMNIAIQLIDLPELANSHKNGDILSFQIVNLSNMTINFPENYGVKLLTNRNNEWIEVQNTLYNAGSIFSLPTKNSYPLGLIVDTSPFMLDLAAPTAVRVIVMGHQENNNEEVGAYIDVIINP